jgi:hypothetical protein
MTNSAFGVHRSAFGVQMVAGLPDFKETKRNPSPPNAETVNGERPQ